MPRRNEKRPADQSKGREARSTASVSQTDLECAYRGIAIIAVAFTAFVWLCEMGWI